MTPDCSIIIPTYNQSLLAQRAIESVRQQQRVSLEIIVCDDSTTDDVAQLIAPLADPRIHYHRNQLPLGAPQNWNHGMSMATGRYVMVLHHDEALTDKLHLWLMMQQLKESQRMVAIANVMVTDHGQHKVRCMPTIIKRWMLRHPATLFAMNAIGPCGCLLAERSVLKAFCNNLHWLVDVEWYYQLLSQQRCCYLPHLFINSCHGHQGQISQTISARQTFRRDASLLRQRYPHKSAIRWMLGWGTLTMVMKQLLHRA